MPKNKVIPIRDAARSENAWFRVRALAGDIAEIAIYGEIGMPRFGDALDDVFDAAGTARQFKAELDALGDVSEIRVRIFSPGGYVWDALAIRDMLRNHPARKTAVIEGLAASAATIVALAADKIEMASNAYFMIHNAVGYENGDHRALLSMAERLESWTANIAGIYADRVQRNRHDSTRSRESLMADIREKMDAETYFTGAEAAEFGLVDVVTSDISLVACLRNADPAIPAVTSLLSRDRMPAPLRAAIDSAGSTESPPTESLPEDSKNESMKKSRPTQSKSAARKAPASHGRPPRNLKAETDPDEEEIVDEAEEEEEEEAKAKTRNARNKRPRSTDEDDEIVDETDEDEDPENETDEDDEIVDEADEDEDPENEEDEDEDPENEEDEDDEATARMIARTVRRAVNQAMAPLNKRIAKLEGKRRAGVRAKAWGDRRPAKNVATGDSAMDGPINLEGRSPMELIHIGRQRMLQAKKDNGR